MIDAFGKIPERLFLGNKELIGAYDECSALDVAKYCRSPVYLFGKIKVGLRHFKVETFAWITFAKETMFLILM